MAEILPNFYESLKQHFVAVEPPAPCDPRLGLVIGQFGHDRIVMVQGWQQEQEINQVKVRNFSYGDKGTTADVLHEQDGFRFYIVRESGAPTPDKIDWKDFSLWNGSFADESGIVIYWDADKEKQLQCQCVGFKNLNKSQATIFNTSGKNASTGAGMEASVAPKKLEGAFVFNRAGDFMGTYRASHSEVMLNHLSKAVYDECVRHIAKSPALDIGAVVSEAIDNKEFDAEWLYQQSLNYAKTGLTSLDEEGSDFNDPKLRYILAYEPEVFFQAMRKEVEKKATGTLHGFFAELCKKSKGKSFDDIPLLLSVSFHLKTETCPDYYTTQDGWDGQTKKKLTHSDVFFRLVETWSFDASSIFKTRSIKLSPASSSSQDKLGSTLGDDEPKAKLQRFIQFLEEVCQGWQDAILFCTMLLNYSADQHASKLRNLRSAVKKLYEMTHRTIGLYLELLIRFISEKKDYCSPKRPPELRCDFYLLSLCAALTPLSLSSKSG